MVKSRKSTKKGGDGTDGTDLPTDVPRYLVCAMKTEQNADQTGEETDVITIFNNEPGKMCSDTSYKTFKGYTNELPEGNNDPKYLKGYDKEIPIIKTTCSDKGKIEKRYCKTQKGNLRELDEKHPCLDGEEEYTICEIPSHQRDTANETFDKTASTFVTNTRRNVINTRRGGKNKSKKAKKSRKTRKSKKAKKTAKK